MGSNYADLLDARGSGGLPFGISAVSCSICLEAVTNNGDRSRVKLQCGHEFHLDCIGSAFNARGEMQCPNCRKVERGQWLYANGSQPSPEFSMDDSTQDEDPYDLSYSEMPFGVQWCPFSGLTRLASLFEEGESPPTVYHDLMGHHPIFSEGLNLNAHWNGLSGPTEISSSHAFPAIDLHYQSWDQHQQPNNLPGIFSTIDWRSNGPRSLAPVGPMLASSEHQANGFYIIPSSGRNIQETENSLRSHFFAWERDHFSQFPLVPVEREPNWWGPFHQANGGSDSDIRTNNNSVWYRNGFERMTPSENISHQPVHPSGILHHFI